MTKDPLSTPWTPQEVTEQTRGIDERLPEAITVNRDSTPARHAAGSMNLPGHEDSAAQLSESRQGPAEPQHSTPDLQEGA